MGEQLPIIYVRGFAGGQGGINRAVEDPFYGFNEGSTHVRVGANGKPRFYQFESPLLRLVLDHGYEVCVRGSQQQQLLDAEPASMAASSIWIYRFYDEASNTFGNEPRPYDIDIASKGLADYIKLVLAKTKGAARVNLVAHSMGGLLCRSAIQRHLVGEEHLISKLVTIGTPHGGIDPKLGGGIGDWVMSVFGPNGSDIFSGRKMREYLMPDGADTGDGPWDSRVPVGSFPVERVLSIVGTNAHDYDVAMGMSSRAMGVQSDGLVQIRDAYVKGSARAYIHRAHSGGYGLVNSEEAYQNLRRFLFGALRIQIGLQDITLQPDLVWQADVRVAVRQVPVVMHEQTAANHCPVDLNAEAKGRPTPTSPVPLVTTYLVNGETPTGWARYALHLRIMSLDERGGLFGFGEHLEQIADWEDSLIVDLRMRPDGMVEEGRWDWNSNLAGRLGHVDVVSQQLEWGEHPQRPGSWISRVELPAPAKAVLGDGAHLSMVAKPWD